MTLESVVTAGDLIVLVLVLAIGFVAAAVDTWLNGRVLELERQAGELRAQLLRLEGIVHERTRPWR